MLKQSTRLQRLTITKGFILASLIAGAMALPFLVPVQKAQADNDDSDRGGNSEPLLGSWLLQVTLDPNTVPLNPNRAPLYYSATLYHPPRDGRSLYIARIQIFGNYE